MSFPIFLYHDLSSSEFPRSRENLATEGTVVAGADFERQMALLAARGLGTTALRERLGGGSGRSAVGLTFDDGHASNYRVAFPILRRHGFRAAFFVVAERIGRDSYLGPREIRELVAGGMEVGSHGMTHRYLPTLGEQEVEWELSESRRVLEEVTGRPVEFFAFPGGHYTRSVLDALPRAGYLGACSCRVGMNDAKTDPFLLRRLEVRGSTTLRKFEKSLRPSGIVTDRAVDFVKGVLRRGLGLDAYSRVRRRLYRFYRLGR